MNIFKIGKYLVLDENYFDIYVFIYMYVDYFNYVNKNLYLIWNSYDIKFLLIKFEK